MRTRRIRRWEIVLGVTLALVIGVLASRGVWVPRSAAQAPAATTATPGGPQTVVVPGNAVVVTATPPVAPGAAITPTGVVTGTGPTVAISTTLPRTITVVGEGRVNIKPDVARVVIGVDTIGDSVKLASVESAKTMDALLAALKKAGVAEKDIQTSGYNVWMDLGRSPEGELTGKATYHVNNTVQVTVRKLEQIGTLLDGAIEAGANAINGVTFALDDDTKVESEARQKAVANAYSKAQELARLHNGTVGGVISVSEIIAAGGGYYGNTFDMGYRYAAGLGGGAGPVTPGELELSLSLQVVYELK